MLFKVVVQFSLCLSSRCAGCFERTVNGPLKDSQINRYFLTNPLSPTRQGPKFLLLNIFFIQLKM